MCSMDVCSVAKLCGWLGEIGEHNMLHCGYNNQVLEKGVVLVFSEDGPDCPC